MAMRQDFSFSLSSPEEATKIRSPEQHLYPASPSRAQAIAGYRREMLDLVSGLPESSYELSLRDIVEYSRPPPPPPPPLTMDDEKKKKKKQMRRTRSRSVDTGMLINLFLPLSVGSRKKVSPKPPATGAKNAEKKKEDEEEWCEKSRTGNHSNGGSSTNHRKRIGCYSFLMSNKSKNGFTKE